MQMIKMLQFVAVSAANQYVGHEFHPWIRQGNGKVADQDQPRGTTPTHPSQEMKAQERSDNGKCDQGQNRLVIEPKHGSGCRIECDETGHEPCPEDGFASDQEANLQSLGVGHCGKPSGQRGGAFRLERPLLQ